ncbi:hypothetical protein Q3G72_017600 [Acer saccharum]|nr:hypothetical protein Q3G72_017600 [Acer saccharum]
MYARPKATWLSLSYEGMSSALGSCKKYSHICGVSKLFFVLFLLSTSIAAAILPQNSSSQINSIWVVEGSFGLSGRSRRSARGVRGSKFLVDNSVDEQRVERMGKAKKDLLMTAPWKGEEDDESHKLQATSEQL